MRLNDGSIVVNSSNASLDNPLQQSTQELACVIGDGRDPNRDIFATVKATLTTAHNVLGRLSFDIDANFDAAKYAQSTNAQTLHAVKVPANKYLMRRAARLAGFIAENMAHLWISVPDNRSAVVPLCGVAIRSVDVFDFVAPQAVVLGTDGQSYLLARQAHTTTKIYVPKRLAK